MWQFLYGNRKLDISNFGKGFFELQEKEGQLFDVGTKYFLGLPLLSVLC